MKLGFALLLLFLSTNISSQNHLHYKPLVNYAPTDSLINSLAYKLKKPNYSTSLKKASDIKTLNEIYVKRSDYLKELQKDMMLMQYDPITNLLQEITDLLLKDQQHLTQEKITVFTVRDNEINAFSIGKGIILLNISLLERLNSWEEIAFVIGHEAGHDIQLHALKSSEKNILILNDKSLKEDLKKASKKEYGSYTAINDIYYNIISLTSMHSRENELQSDSVGYFLTGNIGLSEKGAYDVLSTLDSADYFLYNTKIDIVKTFSNKNYTFNEEWLQSGAAASSWSVAKGLYHVPDSLKTHPNVGERKKQIDFLRENDTGSINKTKENYEQLEKKFEALKKMIVLESVLTQIESGNYAFALYNAINIKSIYAEEPFVDYLIAHSLLEIIVALKNQQFNAHVPFPSKKFPENFNELLHFLHNINSSKLIVVYNNYVNAHLTEEAHNEYKNFLGAYAKFYIEKNADEILLNVPYTNYYHQKIVKEIKAQLIKKK